MFARASGQVVNDCDQVSLKGNENIQESDSGHDCTPL